jgi:hypothetical protein
MVVKAQGLVVRMEWDFPASAAIKPTCHSPSYGVETAAVVLDLRAIVEAEVGCRNFRISWTAQI